MNYYGIPNSTDHLAHYGVKGMRWGVRRAIVTSNQRLLDKHYRKAAKKLAKLQDIGNNGFKYAAKAGGYGAAALGTGALAIGGTGLAAKGISAARKGIRGTAKLITGKDFRPLSSMDRAAGALDKWGQKNDFGVKLARKHMKITNAYGTTNTARALNVRKKLRSLSNSDYYRIGNAVATLGLAAKAAQNAYRAKNSEKYREKAEKFKEEMDNAFGGTQYEGHYEKTNRIRQARRRRLYGG